MTAQVYLDNAATTRALPSVCEAVQQALDVSYGNPSSLHTMGLGAEHIIRQARRSLAAYLHVPERGIIFTSGGTEANNLAIVGSARSYRRRGRHIVISSIEHSAVLEPCAMLEREGWRVTRVGVDHRGRVSVAELAQAITEDTVLVSVMAVNNEVGTIQPVADIVQAVRRRNPRCLIHTDAIQGLGKVPLDLTGWDVDLASFSAHKIHGPKGCGALWVREGVRLEPTFHGGGQEAGMRSGTENVPGIAGFGAAIEHLKREGAAVQEGLITLRDRLIREVKSMLPEVVFNSPDDEDAAPHICNLAIPGWRGEVLVHALAEEGVFVSTGAACSSRRREPGNHVLKAMQLTEETVVGSLRISLSELNTVDDVDFAVRKLAKVLTRLDHREGGSM